jgi:cyclic pyranopterin phosphate synthase
MTDFTHLNAAGESRMVDVGQKPVTRRSATAAGLVRMQLETAQRVRAVDLAKGDVLAVARLAGIQAAKRTDELIPLCHQLPLDAVSVEFLWPQPEVLEIRATATATARTGVEMEALVAVSIAALTVYDMCKSGDRTMIVERIVLVEKSGGKSGDFRRGDTSA